VTNNQPLLSGFPTRICGSSRQPLFPRHQVQPNGSFRGLPQKAKVDVTSTKGLTITGNKYMPGNAVKLSDWHMQHYGLDPQKLAPIITINCEDITGDSN
jgi:hypothetical protein